MSQRRRRRAPSEEAPASPRRLTGLVAWLALVISLLALALAVSDQPWMAGVLQRYRRNWTMMRATIGESLSHSAPQDPRPSVAERLRDASTAARLGEDREVSDHLEAAAAALRESAEALPEATRRQWRTLATRLTNLRSHVPTGLEGGRLLSDLATQVEALTLPASPESQ